MTAPRHAGTNARGVAEAARARHVRTAASLAAIGLVLGGCASFSPDAGLAVAGGYAAHELHKDIAKANDEGFAPTADARVDQLLRRSLTADGAVQVALLKNKGLQAAFNDLGVSEAQFVQATLPPAPRFAITQWGLGFNTDIERSVVGSLLELATLPVRVEIARDRFRADQYNAAEQVLRLGGEARRQFYRTVAANQATAFLEQALAGSESASTLARQLGETGALNKLEQAREHAFYSELGAQLGKARVQQRAERERLTRLLGLWDGKPTSSFRAAFLPCQGAWRAGSRSRARRCGSAPTCRWPASSCNRWSASTASTKPAASSAPSMSAPPTSTPGRGPSTPAAA